MKTLKIFVSVCVLVADFCLGVQAAEKPSAANRANLYQQETRKILIRQHWQVSQERSGKIVANKVEQPATPIPFVTVATLTLTFRSDSNTHTVCTANIVSNTYEKTRGEARKFNGPLPYNTPENTKEIQDMLLEAEKQLHSAHSEHTKR